MSNGLSGDLETLLAREAFAPSSIAFFAFSEKSFFQIEHCFLEERFSLSINSEVRLSESCELISLYNVPKLF